MAHQIQKISKASKSLIGLRFLSSSNNGNTFDLQSEYHYNFYTTQIIFNDHCMQFNSMTVIIPVHHDLDNVNAFEKVSKNKRGKFVFSLCVLNGKFLDFKIRKATNSSIRSNNINKSFHFLHPCYCGVNGKFSLFSKSLYFCERKELAHVPEKTLRRKLLHAFISWMFFENINVFILGSRLIALGSVPTRTNICNDSMLLTFQKPKAISCTWQYKEIILRQRHFPCRQT